jgi:fructose-bisphosphate aldolase class I
MGKPIPTFLWEERGVVPFLKVDKGQEGEADGVQLMKPIAGLDGLLDRATKLGICGIKMRSVINLNSENGIAAIVKQQFALAAQIDAHGLMPILEPEVSIKSPDKPGAEATLLAELTKGLDTLPNSRRVMLKLTIPDVADFYRPLIEHACRAGSRTFRRLHASRRLRTARFQSRHDRQFLKGIDQRTQGIDERQ